MASWHQLNAWRRDGFPTLAHPTLWTSYNPQGHLSVMRHESAEACMEYCKKTGDIPLPPSNNYSRNK